MLKIIETADGSSSLYNEELDEHYHSIHGSVREAAHVFIKMGLEHLPQKEISIFEMGFGTGLNFMMTYAANEKLGKSIRYTSIEKVPLKEELTAEMNYLKVMNREDLKEVYDKIHQVEWEEYASIADVVSLRKLEGDIEDYIHTEPFDLIYFDAFGPRVQPHLWEKPIFEKMYNQLNTGGVLVTYCAKGAVRRTMQEVGFEVERLPGPPGKREMLRATKAE